jgi:hypothetical protein
MESEIQESTRKQKRSGQEGGGLFVNMNTNENKKRREKKRKA